jgi:thiamine phosphate synthase YjbQ (UPF0047 family)
MRQAATTLQIDTGGRGFYSIGPAVESFARGQGMRTGLLTLFCRHTSASLLIQENADFRPERSGKLPRAHRPGRPDAL